MKHASNRSLFRARSKISRHLGYSPMKHKHLIIAIDGPAGSGKSSTAKTLAKRIKTPYIDTGAMYRALTLKAMNERISFDNKKALVALLKKAKIKLTGKDPFSQKVWLDGKDITHDIRLPELTKNVFYVAQEPEIRREMVKKQRQMGQKEGAVMEGRDIGTKVFPRADYKFYFEASDEIRANRRCRELIASGQKTTLKQVLVDQKKRDATDYNRKEGPLKVAKDAIVIDTSELTIDETIDKILTLMRSRSRRNKRGETAHAS